MAGRPQARVVVIGSGAGGAVTAHELAAGGMDVTVLEEGGRFDLADYGQNAPAAMQRLYRRRGMTPLLGKLAIGFVEGCCVGGSTEINSGFWYRTPPEVLARWKDVHLLAEADAAQLAPHFNWAEELVEVAAWTRPLPESSALMLRGAQQLGWAADIVPRAAARCENSNACAQGCPTGAKQGMSRNLLPRAEARGARIVPDCTATRLHRTGDRVTGVETTRRLAGGKFEKAQFAADHVFVCAGATQTPALLRRSGVVRNIGDTLGVHPMVKMAASFDQIVDAHRSVLPLVQVKEFWPEIVLGGAYFTPGHLALMLSDNWQQHAGRMPGFRHMAAYYVGVKGAGRGRVRPSWSDAGAVSLRYELAEDDLRNLRNGLVRLAELLFAAGARELYPGVHGVPVLRSVDEARQRLSAELPARAMSVTTVHAFSSCPMGGLPERSAADSFGRVHGLQNLYINDASMLPGSPGVNPQGTIMAFARRNSHRFLDSLA
jgi:choline dehydrogenase-like flavoprotein